MEARGFSSAPDSCASRVNPCDVWPFMKLPNGFGSHRYLYSPILLDSQELNNFSSTQPSCPHWCCQSCYYHTYHATLVADGEWKCVRPATISASWQLQVQLLLVTMVTGLLLMGNGDADWNNSGSCCGTSSWYIYSASRSGFSNGEWKCVQPSCFLAGTLHQLLVTIVVGLVSWVMENGEGCVVPAARDAGRAPCLSANWGKDNGQWSQWMEQRFLGRCTVSFEGRSWL